MYQKICSDHNTQYLKDDSHTIIAIRQPLKSQEKLPFSAFPFFLIHLLFVQDWRAYPYLSQKISDRSQLVESYLLFSTSFPVHAIRPNEYISLGYTYKMEHI